MRDCSYKDDWKHFAGDKSTPIHVRCHGGANVQGREKLNSNFLMTPLVKFLNSNDLT